MSNHEPYEVGKGKPPKEYQFKKGHRPERKAAVKDAPLNLVAFFEEPMTVTADGKRKQIHPFEAAFTSLAYRAVHSKDMRAIERFLRSCMDAGLIAPPPSTEEGSIIYLISDAWDFDEWKQKFMELGPPPWDGPRDGLAHDYWREEVLREA